MTQIAIWVWLTVCSVTVQVCCCWRHLTSSRISSDCPGTGGPLALALHKLQLSGQGPALPTAQALGMQMLHWQHGRELELLLPAASLLSCQSTLASCSSIPLAAPNLPASWCNLVAIQLPSGISTWYEHSNSTCTFSSFYVIFTIGLHKRPDSDHEPHWFEEWLAQLVLLCCISAFKTASQRSTLCQFASFGQNR